MTRDGSAYPLPQSAHRIPGSASSRWERITGRPAPALAILNEHAGPRPAPAFVEWLMGLPKGWVTSPALALTHAQQLAALGDGVAPMQAATAVSHLRKAR
jgi:DNA (cytosine-5)-methyltransferase 1